MTFEDSADRHFAPPCTSLSAYNRPLFGSSDPDQFAAEIRKVPPSLAPPPATHRTAMILGGDLGGTKTLLALAEQQDGRFRVVREQRFASQDYPSFDTLLTGFLADAPPIDAACFGVAGPTDGKTAKLTYLPWQLSTARLSRQFGIGCVTLVNDFAAAAHGLDLIEPAQIRTLHAGQPVARAPRVVLGAGTGLGVAGMVWDGNRYRVIAGEGGHIGFAPQTAQQGELWHWLLEQNGRVTTEDIVSGPGLARIYAFLGG